MSPDQKTAWSDADFETMSWHDNHVHGLQIRAGSHGAGELLLDLDYILEWLCATESPCQFRVAPATLTFREVTDLRIEVDYASATAALTPFSIAEIRKSPTSSSAGALSLRWTIALNWPHGSISFAANGFIQTLRGPAMLTAEQWLKPAERSVADGV